MDERTRGVDRVVTDRAETPRQLSARHYKEENELNVRHLIECYEHARAGLYFESENPYSPASDPGIMWDAGRALSWCELNLTASEQECDDANYQAEEAEAQRLADFNANAGATRGSGVSE